MAISQGKGGGRWYHIAGASPGDVRMKLSVFHFISASDVMFHCVAFAIVMGVGGTRVAMDVAIFPHSQC